METETTKTESKVFCSPAGEKQVCVHADGTSASAETVTPVTETVTVVDAGTVATVPSVETLPVEKVEVKNESSSMFSCAAINSPIDSLMVGFALLIPLVIKKLY